MVQKRKTVTRNRGRRPFCIVLAAVVAALVISGVCIGLNLGGGSASTDDQTALQGQSADESAQKPTRTVAPVKKAKTRKELATLAGVGKKGKKLSIIGSSYPANSAVLATAEKRVKAVEKKHKVAFVMVDVKTGQGLSYDSTRKFYCASAIKGPYIIALNKWDRGSIGEDEQELMTRAAEISDNKAYEQLHTNFGPGVTEKLMSYSKATSFEPEYSYGYGSARDFARFWITGYWYFFEDTNGNSSWCRGLFDDVNESFIHQALKSHYKTYSKAGWFPGEEFNNVHNDAGIVMAKVGGESRPYVLAVMSTAFGDEKQLRKLVRSIDAVHEDMMYE